MQTINILQLQINSKLKNELSETRYISFTEDKLKLFKEKIADFLQNNNSIQVSNRNSTGKKEDGFIVLTISHLGIHIVSSSSIKKNEYRFYFNDNKLIINNREVDKSFLDSFIRKIMFIASRVETDNYEVIKS